MSTTTPTASWGEYIAQRLLNPKACPVCGSRELEAGCCPSCGADLRGTIGNEVWEASTTAAAAIRARDELLLRVPRLAQGPVAAAAPAPQTTPTSATPVGAPSAHVVPRPAGSSATLQSVLAIAGAGLFAVAAIVFTFLNPDLADRALRSIIVAFVTLVFLGGSWLLARRGLQFSAEAVGALGLVFVGLDVYAFAQLGTTASGTWFISAAATAAAGFAMAAAGLAARIRTWVWGALLAISLVPPMLGYAIGGSSAAALGHVVAAFVAAGLIEVLPRFAPRLNPGASEGRLLAPEGRMLVAVQVLAILSAVPIALSGAFAPREVTLYLLETALVFALIWAHALFATRHLLRGWWSYVAGAAAASSAVIVVHAAQVEFVSAEWWVATISAAAALSFALLPTSHLPRSVSRSVLASGAISVLAMISIVPLGFAAVSGLDTLSAFVEGLQDPVVLDDPWSWAFLVGLAVIAVGLAAFGRLARRHSTLRAFVLGTDVAAVLVAGVAIVTLACVPLLPLPARIAIVLGAAGTASAALRWVPRLRGTREGIRVVLQLGIHIAIVVGAIVSWRDVHLAPLVGVAVIAALALAAGTVSAGARFLHVGAGFAYALVCVAQALALTDLGNIAVLCITTSAGLLCAIAVTFLARVGARSWYAVLAVTAVPFAAGIVQVLFERSGWTALSTSLMFALALALLLTRRPGLNVILRTIAAGMLVPTIAVVVVCLGAQVLAVSASPVTLPVIAAIVALVLPSTTLISGALRRSGLRADAAAAARVAIEASALLTGAIAVALALARDAAGLGTTFLVLLLLGIGASASALFTGRRYGWWVAGASFTGALWCVWAMNSVDLLEAYLLPPALVAALVAAILTARGPQARGLFATGLSVAVLPSLMLLVLTEPDARTAAEVPWRTIMLLAAGALLLALGTWLGRLPRMRAIVLPTFAVAGMAAVAGPVQGVRIGLGADLALMHGAALFLVCFALAAVAAIILLLAARGIRAAASERVRRSRWLSAPAVLALTVGSWSAIERDWGSIWLMWTLMIGVLVLLLVAAVRAGRTTLPPVWFLFAIAFITAIVAWSPRDLRVEWFSLPLGAFVLLAGISGMRKAHAGETEASAPASVDEWPARWQSSWALLAPGIVIMLSASIVATFTDPLTWRAILVMVLALAAIMVGAGRRLAAPFILGMLVLPVENVFVFAVQLGRGVESMPWWITLAVIGAVLLIIAVTYERRTGSADTVVARVRDLR